MSRRILPGNPVRIDLLLTALLSAGAFLRLLFITAEGLWHDEALAAISTFKPFLEMISFQLYIGHSPLYLFILKPLAVLFGSSELVLRMPSVIFGVLSIYALHVLARELFDNEWIAYTATALFSFSAIQVHFSQEARPYAILVFLSILSFYCFLRALELNRFRLWLAYSVITVLMIYLSATSVFLLAAQFAYSILRKRGSYEFNVSLVVIAFLYFPMVLYYLIKGGSLMGWMSPLSFSSFTNLLFGFLLLPIPLPAGWLISGPYTVIMKGLSLLLLVPLFLGGREAARNKGSKESWSILLLWLWLVLPFALEVAYSAALHPLVGLKKYAMALSPPLYMLLAHAAWSSSPEKMKKAACVLLAVLFAVPLITFYSIPKRDDWRGAIGYLMEEVEQSEPVFTDYGGVPMFEYYWRGSPLKLHYYDNLPKIEFESGWLIMQKPYFHRYIGEENALGSRFEVESIARYPDFTILRLKSR